MVSRPTCSTLRSDTAGAVVDEFLQCLRSLFLMQASATDENSDA